MAKTEKANSAGTLAMPLHAAYYRQMSMNMHQDENHCIERVRVLLVDNHEMVREGLRIMLAAAKDIEVVAEASDGLEAIDKVNEFHPHVVLMDLLMPELDGVEATKRIKSQHPAIAIIALTFNDNNPYIIEAIRAGAVACLLKDVSRALLIRTIRAVHTGNTLPKRGFSHGFTLGVDNVFGNSEAKSVENKPENAAALNLLTRRERDVLCLVTLGMTNSQIAGELCLSEDTTKKYTRNMMLKLGVSNRTQAAVKGICAGIVDNLSIEMTE